MPYFRNLHEHGNYDSVNFLLTRAFAVSAEELADMAIEYILESPQRLEAGWGAGGTGDYLYWASRELIEHCSRYCNDDAFARLEITMLEHFPRWERSKEGCKARGEWQFIMLPALDPRRRSSAVEARIEEWKRRKFPDRKIEPPEVCRVQWVGSPIDSAAIEKMSDEQWLRAIAKYDPENYRGFGSSFRLQSGARELSYELGNEAKREPERFARLCMRFPAGAHPFYFHAVLRTLNKELACSKKTCLRCCSGRF